MMAKEKKPVTEKMTRPMLRQINDASGGGFILFYFDEDGLPQSNSNFVDHPHALALQYYIKNWSEAIDAVTTEAMSQLILGPESDEIDNEEGGEENPPEEI